VKKNIIVAFDFDGTITTKDTLVEFIAFSRGKWRLYGGFLLFSPLLVAMKLSLLSNSKVKQRLFSYFYKGIPIGIFDQWGINFSAKIDDMLRPNIVEKLNLHKKNGDKIIIVSASIENWIKPWANAMGIDTILSTQIELDTERRLTGNFLSQNCYGQEKVDRILEMFPNRHDYKLVAYGDSRGDKEMLKFADEGFFITKRTQKKQS
jgi:HAD superfamily hydrolase (TIGR01490 family)